MIIDIFKHGIQKNAAEPIYQQIISRRDFGLLRRCRGNRSDRRQEVRHRQTKPRICVFSCDKSPWDSFVVQVGAGFLNTTDFLLLILHELKAPICKTRTLNHSIRCVTPLCGAISGRSHRLLLQALNNAKIAGKRSLKRAAKFAPKNV